MKETLVSSFAFTAFVSFENGSMPSSSDNPISLGGIHLNSLSHARRSNGWLAIAPHPVSRIARSGRHAAVDPGQIPQPDDVAGRVASAMPAPPASPRDRAEQDQDQDDDKRRHFSTRSPPPPEYTRAEGRMGGRK